MKYFYSERESKNLELKSQIPTFQSLVKTCVAFANGIGGKIVIGVEDKSKEIIGIDNKTRERIYDEFPNCLYDSTSPNLLAEIYEKRFNDVSVIIIEIPYSIKKPVFVRNEGIPNGVYLRAGPNTRRASQESIEELIRENKRINFDEAIVHEDMNILSKSLIRNVYRKIDINRLLADKIIMRSHFDAKKFHPTITGVLFFNELPDLYVPEANVRCTRFHGINGREIIQTEEIRGPLENQTETSFELLKSWLTREYKLFGAKLKGKMVLPEIALREAIINALIHRKYWVPGATKIALYDNRLEIFSPGNFPGLVDPNHLGDGTTYLRNPNLARVARRLGIIEKLGTGIKLIFESCHKAGITKPEFIEGADSVKVIFNFLPEHNRLDQAEDKLLALFNMRDEIKLADVEKYLKVSRNTATRKLNHLIKLKKVKRLGKGPAVRYLKC